MITVENLTKVYKTKRGVKTVALDCVDLSFGNSGLVFILGKSGSGKTTLLYLLGGLDCPTSGTVAVDGKVIDNSKQKQLDEYRNKYIGFVFQEYNLISEYTVAQNIALALELQNGRDGGRVDEVLRKVDLVGRDGNTLGDRKVTELSGGQKQRVAIARALVKDTAVILADEPTGALDTVTGRQLYELLKQLSKERLVIVVTHDKNSAREFGDRIIEIADGKVINDDNRLQSVETVSSEKTVVSDGKSGLPVKRAFLMGLAGLKSNILRLVLSIVLCVISFAGFGFSLTALNADNYSAELASMSSKNMHCAILKSENKKYERTNNNLLVEVRKPFTRFQLDTIAEYGNGAPVKITENEDSVMAYLGITGDEGESEELNSLYYNIMFSESGLIELNPETGLKDAKLKADRRFKNKELCRLPENKDEIAITDLHADAFIEFGYLGDDDETICKINTPDDLIGKKIGFKTICGVFSTEIDKEYFYENRDKVALTEEDSYMRKYFSGAAKSIITYSFGYCGEFEYESEVSDVLIRINGSASETKKFFKKLGYEDGELTCGVNIVTVFSAFLLEESVMDIISKAGIISSVVLVITSVLILMNFLSVNFQYRQRTLGILRALGASKTDITAVCLWESFIITAINFVLSLIIILTVCLCVNHAMFVSVFNFGILQFAILASLCFAVSAVATVIPAVKLLKKSPVDIIKSCN